MKELNITIFLVEKMLQTLVKKGNTIAINRPRCPIFQKLQWRNSQEYFNIYLTSLLILLFFSTIKSQTSFQKYISTNDFPLKHFSIQCENKACYVLSDFQTINEYIPSGLIITKINELGQKEWSKRYYFDYLATSYTQTFLTDNKDLVILLRVRHTYDYTYGEPVIWGYDFGLIMLKISADGRLLWDVHLDPSHQNIEPIKITEVSGGDYVLLSKTSIMKISEAGEKIWKKQLQFGEDFELVHIGKMSDDGLLIAGQKARGTEFPDNLYNTVLIKVSPNGTVIWSKIMQDFRTWGLNIFRDEYILLTGHRLNKNTEIQFIRLTPDGTVRWTKHLPQKSRFLRNHTTILEDGSILDFINTGSASILVKLNEEAEVLWARSYLANDNSHNFLSNWGNLIGHTQDGGIIMLNNRIQKYEEDLIIKTDKQGKLEHCYTANWCTQSLETETPQMQDVNITVVDEPEGELSFTPLNHNLMDVPLFTKDYCAKINVPSPFFLFRDTICINTPPLLDSLCQEEANAWLWQADGRTFSSQSTPQDLLFETAGLHQLTHIIEVNGCRDTFSRIVQVVDAPNFELGQDSVLCEDEPFLMNITQGNLRNYIWEDSLLGATRTIHEGGVYTAFAEDDYCQVSASRKIDFIHELFSQNPIHLGTDTTICQQLPLVLAAEHPEANSYTWENNSTTPTRSITQAGVYRIQANIAGCPFEDEIVVKSKDCAGQLYIPTAFSPNGDGQNDHFEIGTKYAEISNIQIFNRWGTVVYEGTQAWDGHINQIQAQEGLYVYKIEYIETLLEKHKQVMGELVLIQ